MSDIREATRDFNPRLREGGDNTPSISELNKKIISIHASAKEATKDLCPVDTGALNFNPRLREGGDAYGDEVTTWNQISIHASAKEATESDEESLIINPNFNPRLREGGDIASGSLYDSDT